jgi:hypothetical protein
MKALRETDTSRLPVATVRTIEIAIHSVEGDLLLFAEDNFKTFYWVRDLEKKPWKIQRGTTHSDKTVNSR